MLLRSWMSCLTNWGMHCHNLSHASFDFVARIASQETRDEFLKQSRTKTQPSIKHRLFPGSGCNSWPTPFHEMTENFSIRSLQSSRIYIWHILELGSHQTKNHREYRGVAYMPKTPDWRQLLMTENEDSSWHDSSQFFAPWLAPAHWAMICPN